MTPLIRLLDDPAAEVRCAAAHALGIWGDSRAVPALTRLQHQPDHSVAEAARQALYRLQARLSARPDSVVTGTASALQPARIFISSTFADMQAERDLLMKYVFPEISRRCRERGFDCVGVDLRWGIPEAASEQGASLLLCLQSIDRCQPFFLGLVGQRYGWIFAPAPTYDDGTVNPHYAQERAELDRTLREYPALQPYAVRGEDGAFIRTTRSITELEIRYGALNHAPGMRQALFCIRDGRPGASVERETLLDDLRHEIDVSGYPVIHYDAPHRLRDELVEALWQQIEAQYPPSSAHTDDAWSFARYYSRAYVPLTGMADVLDRHVAESGPPLVLTAAAGMGKTALLAWWLLQREADVDVIPLFIGQRPEASSPAHLLRYLLETLQQRYGFEEVDMDDPAAALDTLRSWFGRVPVDRRLVLIFDGLDHLAGHEALPSLVWLPDAFPNHVRVIVSAAPDTPAAQAVQQRGWRVVNLPPPDNRQQMITAYNHYYDKVLSDQLLTRLVTANQTTNPLFLRLLLADFRLYGYGREHELTAQLDDYLQAGDTEALIVRVFERLERDYEQGQRGWVAEALGLLAVSRDGLTASEIMQLAGDVRWTNWTPLVYALEDILSERGGLLTFSSVDARRAAERCYVPTAQIRRRLHQKLASHFAAQPLTAHVIQERLWHLTQMGDDRSLRDLLPDPEFLTAAWQVDRWTVRALWERLDMHSQTAPVRRAPQNYSLPFLEIVAALSQPETALILWHEVDRRSGAEAGKRDEALISIARSYTALADYEKAEIYYKRAIRFYEQHDSDYGRVSALHGYAALLTRWGEMDRAATLYAQVADVLNGQSGLMADALRAGNQADWAGLLHQQGDAAGALARIDDAVRTYHQLGDYENLAIVLGTKGRILRSLGRFPAAHNALAEAVFAAQQVNNQRTLQNTYTFQGDVYLAQADHTAALHCYTQAEAICRRIEYRRGLGIALGSQGNVYLALGDYGRALDLNQQAQAIAVEVGNKRGQAVSVGSQATAYLLNGDQQQAEPLLHACIQLAREVQDQETLAAALSNLALVLSDTGRLAEAIQMQREAESLYTALQNPIALAKSKGHLAEVLAAQNSLSQAERKAQEALTLARDYGLNDLGRVLQKQLAELRRRK